jgi:hypothetical protein
MRATSADVVTKRGSSPNVRSKNAYAPYLAGMMAAWPEDYLAQRLGGQNKQDLPLLRAMLR